MKVVKYFFVGAAAAAIDIGIFSIAVKMFQLPWFPVALVSFVVATAANYALSIRHVFRSGARFRRSAEVSLVFLVSGIGLVINQTVLWAFIEKVAIDPVLAKFVATGVVFFWNYSMRSAFIFRHTR